MNGVLLQPSSMNKWPRGIWIHLRLILWWVSAGSMLYTSWEGYPVPSPQLLPQYSLKKLQWRLPGAGRGELQASLAGTQDALSQRSRINHGWWECHSQGHVSSTLWLNRHLCSTLICNIVPMGKCLLNPNDWFGKKLGEHSIAAGDFPYLDRLLR